MAIFKCKMCGGDLDITEGKSTAECEYCGSIQTIPNADNEKKLTLFGRANRLRLNSEFDKAAGVYETIVADFPEEAEAYWGLVLCRYGIEYVDDPAGKKIPTCHRSSFESIMDDSDFEQACENADSVALRVYREEAKAIEEIRKGIISVSAKEEPYDIFICYKETDEKGDRTLDSVLAQDIYEALTDKGYRVFFSRITLEDKLGVEYEPYIFAALNSAKIMLAFGTAYEYYNAVWVKNEWSRYLKLMAKDKEKHLIPCYKGIDAYDMPKEFAKLQAQDLGKVGATQDLLRGIEKILPKKEERPVKTESVVINAQSNTDALLKRVEIFLKDKDWVKADEYCEKVLDTDPECAEAYLGKLMAELRVQKREFLKHYTSLFSNSNNYKKVMTYGDKKLKEEISGYNDFIANRIKTQREDGIYKRATDLMSENNVSSLSEAKKLFGQITGYKDSADLAVRCGEMIPAATYNEACSLKSQKTADSLTEARKLFEKLKDFKDSAQQANECRLIITGIENDEKYRAAKSLMVKSNIESFEKAADIFEEIKSYKDSEARAAECRDRIKNMKEAKARRLEEERVNAEKAKTQAKRKAKTLRVIILILLAVIAGAVFFGIANRAVVKVDGMTFEKRKEGYVLVSSAREYETEIPGKIMFTPVVGIADDAFSGDSFLTSVIIPDSVVSIGANAFNNCESLTSITIPYSVASIGENAFYNCDSLVSITIPDSVTYIGADAFVGCDNLKTVKLSASITEIPEGLFTECDALSDITIPNSVTYIGADAFRGCRSLKSIELPDLVTVIETNAFQGCVRMTDIDLSDSLRIIGETAFSRCEALTGIVIPDSVTAVYTAAFANCKSLKSVTLSSSLTSINNEVFVNCTSLESIELPDSVIGLCSGAFSYCESLKSITLTDSLSTIQIAAFYECSSIESITIPASVTYIANNAFYGCDNMTVICPAGSYAEQYAKENDIPYRNS